MISSNQLASQAIAQMLDKELINEGQMYTLHNGSIIGTSYPQDYSDQCVKNLSAAQLQSNINTANLNSSFTYSGSAVRGVNIVNESYTERNLQAYDNRNALLLTPECSSIFRSAILGEGIYTPLTVPGDESLYHIYELNTWEESYYYYKTCQYNGDLSTGLYNIYIEVPRYLQSYFYPQVEDFIYYDWFTNLLYLSQNSKITPPNIFAPPDYEFNPSDYILTSSYVYLSADGSHVEPISIFQYWTEVDGVNSWLNVPLGRSKRLYEGSGNAETTYSSATHSGHCHAAVKQVLSPKLWSIPYHGSVSFILSGNMRDPNRGVIRYPFLYASTSTIWLNLGLNYLNWNDADVMITNAAYFPSLSSYSQYYIGRRGVNGSMISGGSLITFSPTIQCVGTITSSVIAFNVPGPTTEIGLDIFEKSYICMDPRRVLFQYIPTVSN